MALLRSVLALAVPLALAGGLSMSAAPAEAQKKLDGKQVFLDQKCETCHAVSSANVKATGKIKAPDLTGLAPQQDATLIIRYLRKQAQIKGKTHVKAFTGTDEQLGALVAWLQDQKKAAAK